MKKVILGAVILIPVVLTACTSTQSSNQKLIGMANPASQYCIEQGGKLIPQKNSEGGEYALCQLPDGQIVEEWELFRKNHPQK